MRVEPAPSAVQKQINKRKQRCYWLDLKLSCFKFVPGFYLTLSGYVLCYFVLFIVLITS